MRLAVVGASGRMGLAVVRLAKAMKGVEIVCAVADRLLGQDVGLLAGIGSLGVCVEGLPVLSSCSADAVIDFSTPAGLSTVASVASSRGMALVSGTTGLAPEHQQALATAAKQIPVLWEANMSRGVHVLAHLLQRAAALLGVGFEIELVETHHRRKVDAPSGTALKLVDAMREVRPELRAVYGREGHPGPRHPDEIGVHAVRGGDVMGDHTVTFFGEGERIELTHRASTRDLWARGALDAACWLVGKAPGLYRLGDSLQSLSS